MSIYISTNNARTFLFSTYSLAFIVCKLFDDGHYYQCELISHCRFDPHFSKCQQTWKTQQWPQDWKRLFSFQSQKKGNAKECSNYCTIALISHASNDWATSLHFTFRIQWCVNQEHPDVQAGFRKGRGTIDQVANIHWIIEKAKEFQKNVYFCFFDCAEGFDCVDHNSLWTILKRGRIPDHLTCVLKNLYASQEATVRTRHEKPDWFKIEAGVCQACLLSPCLFNLYAEYITWNARLDEAQVGIKISLCF